MGAGTTRTVVRLWRNASSCDGRITPEGVKRRHMAVVLLDRTTLPLVRRCSAVTVAFSTKVELGTTMILCSLFGTVPSWSCFSVTNPIGTPRKLAASNTARRLTVDVSSCVSEAILRKIQSTGFTLPMAATTSPNEEASMNCRRNVSVAAGSVAKEPTKEPGNLVAFCGATPSRGKYHATHAYMELVDDGGKYSGGGDECKYGSERMDIVTKQQQQTARWW